MGEKHDLMLNDFVEHMLANTEGEFKHGVEEPFSIQGVNEYVDFFILSSDGNLKIFGIKEDIEKFENVGEIIRQYKTYVEHFSRRLVEKFVSSPGELNVFVFAVIPPDRAIIEKIRDTLTLFKGTGINIIIFSREAYDKNKKEYKHLMLPIEISTILRDSPDYKGMDDKEIFFFWINEGLDALDAYKKTGDKKYFEYLEKNDGILKKVVKNLEREEKIVKINIPNPGESKKADAKEGSDGDFCAGCCIFILIIWLIIEVIDYIL